MSAREYEPGRWVMFDSFEKPYALIDIIRRGDEVGYRVTTWKQEPAERKVLGYFTTLAASASSAHGQWINRGVPHHSPNGSTNWPAYKDPWA